MAEGGHAEAVPLCMSAKERLPLRAENFVNMYFFSHFKEPDTASYIAAIENLPSALRPKPYSSTEPFAEAAGRCRWW